MKTVHYFLLVLFLYCVVLLEVSFFTHWQVMGRSLNWLLLLILFINFFEKEQSKAGLFSAFFSGLFLDVFSGWPFGLFCLAFLFSALLIKKLAPFFEHSSLGGFLFTFCLVFGQYFLTLSLLKTIFWLFWQRELAFYWQINFLGWFLVWLVHFSLAAVIFLTSRLFCFEKKLNRLKMKKLKWL